MMNIYDLISMPAGSGGKPVNVFHDQREFTTRIIDVEPGRGIPPCRMESHLMFYVLKGTVEITCNDESAQLTENQLFITDPATVSMRSAEGARVLGVQIHSGELT